MKLKILAIIILFCTAGLFACGTAQKAQKAGDDSTGIQNSAAPKDTVIITGMVQIYGNAPHTFAGIASEDGKTYAVYPREKEMEIRSLQGRRIEFTVRILESPAGEGSLYLKDGTVTPLSWRILGP
jgi:ABC-type oligopeptide transport system substrate-binding subunit